MKKNNTNATGKMKMPPAGRIVYTTLNGQHHHYKRKCYGVFNAYSMGIYEARAEGKTPCSRCCYQFRIKDVI